jgi:Integrase core domain
VVRPFLGAVPCKESLHFAGLPRHIPAQWNSALVTPVQAPNANACAERWVRTVRAECLDWLPIIGRDHLEQILRVYAVHYNTHRLHRALGLEPPDPPPIQSSSTTASQARVHRRDLLGGLLHEYHRRAAWTHLRTLRAIAGIATEPSTWELDRCWCGVGELVEVQPPGRGDRIPIVCGLLRPAAWHRQARRG